jgi:hypothetical protein
MPKINREALIKELLELRQHYAPYEPRDAEIRALLIGDAKGENFNIAIPGLGKANVSAAQDKRCTGEEPSLVVDKFLALLLPERKKLIKAGLVVVEKVWKKAYAGRVTVELF